MAGRRVMRALMTKMLKEAADMPMRPSETAKLIVFEYKTPGAKGNVAVIGKGLTFDSGGISIKPAAKMDEMKYDMSGGAAVLGVFQALSQVDVPYEVHGLVPTSENLPAPKLATDSPGNPTIKSE